MDRESKKNTVKNLKENFKDSEGVVVTHYLGLNNSELTELRIKVKEVGAKFWVAKNSLIKLASKDTPSFILSLSFSSSILSSSSFSCTSVPVPQ